VPSVSLAADSSLDKFPVCDVQWDATGITCTMPAGKGGYFDLSLWHEGVTMHVCYVVSMRVCYVAYYACWNRRLL
jgi:hypothetical protein